MYKKSVRAISTKSQLVDISEISTKGYAYDEDEQELDLQQFFQSHPDSIFKIILTNEVSENEIMNFIKLLIEHKIPCDVSIEQPTTQNEILNRNTWNNAFEKIYRRNLFLKGLSVAPKNNEVSARHGSKKIRESKKLYLKSKKGKVKLEVRLAKKQEKKQQKQQQQQQSTTSTSLINRRRAIKSEVASTINHEELKQYNKDQTLITEANIANPGHYPNNQQALDIWKQVVGPNANLFEVIEGDVVKKKEIKPVGFSEAPVSHVVPKITMIEKRAMDKIIEHQTLFKDGLIYDNLPAGFYLEQKENDLILRFNEEKEKLDLLQPQSPLSFLLPKAIPPFDNDHTQLLYYLAVSNEQLVPLMRGETTLNQYPNIIKSNFDVLLGAADKNVKLPLLKNIINDLKPILPDAYQKNLLLEDLITKVLVPLKSDHITWVTKILIKEGPTKLILMLETLNQLKEKDYELFKQLNIDSHLAKNGGSDELLTLATGDGISALTRILSMNPNEKDWWVSLTSQHEDKRFDVVNQLKAFDYFIKTVGGEIKSLKESLNEDVENFSFNLPPKSPFSKITNMYTALDRALFMIKSSPWPDEQLNNLDGLDWSQEGAYYAMRFSGYKRVSKGMDLTPSSAKMKVRGSSGGQKEIVEYSLSSKDYTKKMSSLDIIDGNQRKLLVLSSRYIGQHYNAYEFTCYDELYKMIDREIESFLSESYKEQKFFLKKIMHQFINVTATGKNYYVSDYESACSELLSSIKKFLSGILKDALDIYLIYMDRVGRDLSKLEEDKRPNLTQLNGYVMQILSSATPDFMSPNAKKPSEDSKFITSTLLVFEDGASIVDNCHKRNKLFKVRNRDKLEEGSIIQNQQEIDNFPFFYFIEEMFICFLNEEFVSKKLDLSYHTQEQYYKDNELKKDIITLSPTELEPIAKLLSLIETEPNPEDNSIPGDMLESLHKYNGKGYNSYRGPLLRGFLIKIYALIQKLDLDKKDNVESNKKTSLILLDVLTEINPEKSTKLPNIKNIFDLIDALQHEKNLPINNETELKVAIKTFVQNYLPQTKFGSDDPKPSDMKVIDLIKEFAVQMKLKDHYNDLDNISKQNRTLFSMIPGAMNFMECIDDFIKELEKSTVDETELYKKFVKVDNKFRNSSFIVKQAVAQSDNVLGDGFFENEILSSVKHVLAKEPNKESNLKKEMRGLNLNDQISDDKFKATSISHIPLSSLLKIKLDDKFYTELANLYKELQLGVDDKLFAKLKDDLGLLNIDGDFAANLNKYAASFEEKKQFLNALLNCKNDNLDHFKKLYASYLKHNTIPYPIHEKLFNLLTSLHLKFPNSSFEGHLEKIYQLLEKNSKKIDLVVTSLKDLLDFSNDISSEVVNKLLEESINYYDTLDQEFPIKELFSILVAKKDEEDDSLLKSLLPVILNADNNIAIVSNETKKALANEGSELVKLMLSLYKGKEDTGGYIELLKLYNDKSNLEITSRQIKIILGSILDKGKVRGGEPKQIEDILKFLNKLRLLEKPVLNALAELYDYPPAPNFTLLQRVLNEPQSISDFIANYDSDPFYFGRKAKSGVVPTRGQMIKSQFDDSRLLPVLGEIRTMIDGALLPVAEQIKLAKQFTAINELGNNYEFEGIIDITFPKKKKLIDFSRKELKSFALKLITLYQKENNPAEKEKQRIALVAIIREILFRTTGMFLRSTQILSLLITFSRPHNLLLQINTGEGKGLSTALFNLFESFDEKTVNAYSANTDLSERDFKEFKSVFEFLGINGTYVTPNAVGSYAPGGINYTTSLNLPLYYDAAEMMSEDVKRKKGDVERRKYASTFVIDESDYTILDLKTPANFSVPSFGQGDPSKNIYKSFYSLVLKFIKTSAAYQDQHVDDFSEEDDVIELRRYLYENCTERDLLDKLSNEQLSKWLDDAVNALMFKDKEQYLANKKIKRIRNGVEEEVTFAVPLDDSKIPQEESSFDGSTQQFIHTELNKGGDIYPIDPEVLSVRSQLSGNFILSNLTQKSRLIGISGTIGMNSDLYYQASLYDTEAIRIPTHFNVHRNILPLKVGKNHREQVKYIKKTIERAGVYEDANDKKHVQPMLLICGDGSKAEQLFTDLTGLDCKKFQKVKSFLIKNSQLSTGAGVLDKDKVSTQDLAGYANAMFKKSKTLKQEFNAFINRISSNGYSCTEKDIKDFMKFANGKTNDNVNYVVLTGNETSEERENIAKYISGNPNTITISTPVFARGTNIPTEHPDGLLTFATDLVAENEMIQIMGRSSRDGWPGSFVAILNDEEVKSRFGDENSLYKLSDSKRKIKISEIQKRISEESAVHRYYLQESDRLKNVIIKQMSRYFKIAKLMDMHNLRNPFYLQDKMLLKFEKALKDMNIIWNKLLSNIDDKIQTDNPYIRRNKKGELSTESLDKCLLEFESELEGLWGSIQKEMKGDEFKTLETSYNKNAARYHYLNTINLRDDFRQSKKEQFLTKDRNKETKKGMRQRAGYATNPKEALIQYLPGVICPYDDNNKISVVRQNLILDASEIQLKLLSKHLKEVLESLPSYVAKKNLSKDIADLQKSLNPVDNEDLPQRIERIKVAISMASTAVTKSASLCQQNNLVSHGHKVIPIAEQVVKLEANFKPIFNFRRVMINQKVIETVLGGIFEKLHNNLSWAEEENRGILYKLERKKIKDAASKLLAELKAYKAYISNQGYDEDKLKMIISNIYGLLIKYQVELKDIISINLGHTDIEIVIKEALNELNDFASVTNLLGKEERLRHVEKVAIQNNLQKFKLQVDEFQTIYSIKFSNKGVVTQYTEQRARFDSLCLQINAIIANENNTVLAWREIELLIKKNRFEINKLISEDKNGIAYKKMDQYLQELLQKIPKYLAVNDKNLFINFDSNMERMMNIKGKDLNEKLIKILGQGCTSSFKIKHVGFKPVFVLVIEKNSNEGDFNSDQFPGFRQIKDDTREQIDALGREITKLRTQEKEMAVKLLAYDNVEKNLEIINLNDISNDFSSSLKNEINYFINLRNYMKVNLLTLSDLRVLPPVLETDESFKKDLLRFEQSRLLNLDNLLALTQEELKNQYENYEQIFGKYTVDELKVQLNYMRLLKSQNSKESQSALQDKENQFHQFLKNKQDEFLNILKSKVEQKYQSTSEKLKTLTQGEKLQSSIDLSENIAYLEKKKVKLENKVDGAPARYVREFKDLDEVLNFSNSLMTPGLNSSQASNV